MNHTIRIGILVVGLTFLANPFVAASVPSATSPSSQPIVLKISDLRSAYLLRTGVVHYDPTAMSTDGVRRQIQRHFDVVLGLLLVATPQNIETALDRLEASADTNWSAHERAEWRRQLLANRYLQMRRLAAYRDRGLFPQNQGQATGPVPIFVDRHDTACAVGHLMRVSGWQTFVAQIERMNNLIYVPEARHSAVAHWVLSSGLTLEEAALIQPGYPFIVNQFMSQYGPGGQALIQDGLRYENFQLTAANFINPPTNVDPSLCRSNPDSCLGTPSGPGGFPNATHVGIRAGMGTYSEPMTLTYLDPVGTHWLGIGGVFPNLDPALINGQAPAERAQQITIQFDVAPVSPNMKIDQITQHTDDLESGFFPVPMGPAEFNYVMVTRVLNNQSQIASTTMDRQTPIQLEPPPSNSNGEQISTVSFQPLSHITVKTDLYLINGVAVNSVALDFNVIQVPEPESILILVTLVAGILSSGKGLRRREP